MKITEDLLAAGISERGGFSKSQLALLGVEWPPPKGWKHTIIGMSISNDAATEFVRFADRRTGPEKNILNDVSAVKLPRG